MKQNDNDNNDSNQDIYSAIFDHWITPLILIKSDSHRFSLSPQVFVHNNCGKVLSFKNQTIFQMDLSTVWYHSNLPHWLTNSSIYLISVAILTLAVTTVGRQCAMAKPSSRSRLTR